MTFKVDIANEKQLFRLLSIPGIICSICSIICQIYSNQILSVHLKRHYPFEINRIIVESSYPYQTPWCTNIHLKESLIHLWTTDFILPVN